MKHINIKAIFGAAAFLSLAVACKKETGPVVSVIQTNFSAKTTVQVFNGILNATRNYIYVDGNAVTGAAVPFNGVFPATPAANFVVNPGLKAFLVRDTLPTATQVPLSFAEHMDVSKYYTIFLYDTLNTPKQKTVVNDIVIPNDTTARVRFANFIFTRTAVPNVDIFSVKRNANVFTNVPITDVTGYVPYASGLNDTLHVRETGTAVTLASLNGFNPTRQRSYTLVFRGRYQTTGTTGIARLLTAFANY